MKKIDFLFLHPTTHFKILPEGEERLRYVIMPMGTIALADLLNREGYEVKIVHTGLEQMLNPHFVIESLLKRYEATLVGIDLHWYSHAYDAIRIANIVKEFSNAFVVLGGFTASFFSQEILSHFNSIDAIICGDAEQPMVELLRYKSKKSFENVSNLLYRNGKAIKKSKKTYLANKNDLDQLQFSNLSPLENWEKYIKLICEHDDIRPKLKTQGWTCIGRGCSVNCSYCGGGKKAYKIITGRQNPVFRSKERIIETLAKFQEMKISCAYMDFDPYPSKRNYYRELFAMIRKEKIDMSAQFLLWTLSDRSFLRDFKRTFNPLYTTITLSPESGSEYIRKLNKGFYYNNQSLFRWLSNAKDEMIPVELYFTSGLSLETEGHFKETIQLGEKITKKYPMVVSLCCNPIMLEPCSPRFLSPEKYGITMKFKKFIDFYETYRRFAEGLPVESRLGYETNSLSEEKIIELSLRFGERLSKVEENRLKMVPKNKYVI